MPLLLVSPQSPMAGISIQRSPLLFPSHRGFLRASSRVSLPNGSVVLRNRFRNCIAAASVEKEEAELILSSIEEEEAKQSVSEEEKEAELGVSDEEEEEEEEEEEDLEGESSREEREATPEDLEDIAEIKRVLEILKKKRDMTFGEVKLTIMIEDPRDVERKRLLGIEDPDEITKDDLADALVDVSEGRIPENRLVLRLLAKEMSEWPDLDVEIEKKKKGINPMKSLYAKITDTGVDPETVAKKLNVDWDSAADIEDQEEEQTEVPSAVGYGALYLVTGFPILIGVSVVLILFYNSLQ